MIQPIIIEISPGELLDKLTILRIKAQRIHDPARRQNVMKELEILENVRRKAIPDTPALRDLTTELSRINLELWDVEDSIRQHEAKKNFSQQFIESARSVYRLNSIRTQLKRRINELLHSPIQEEKQYSAD